MTDTGAPQAAGTLFDALERAASRYGDREFLITGRRAEVATFRDLAERAEAFGRLLAGLGVRPGDRVALWMTNRVDWAVAAYGTARCGAVLVAVNTRLAAREVAHMLVLTRPKVWVMEDVFLGKIQATERVGPVLAELRRQSVPEPVVLVRSAAQRRYPETLDWHDALAAASTALPPAAELVTRGGGGEFPELAGVAAILSTSGTTAAPKGVMLSHGGLIRLAAAVAERQELRPGQRFYSVGPFFHCSGFMHALLANLISGSTVYTTQAYDPEESWAVWTSERITLYHGFVIPLQEVARLPGFDRSALALDRAWYGAPAVEMARLETLLGAQMCEIYGLTETGGCVSICRPDDPKEMRHDSDGRPFEGIEVAIVDPATGRPLPDGTPGEILVRGWNVMQGYFRDAEATRRTIDAEGWLHTGDQGVRLPGGFIKWLSRLKDVIRVGGENLSPLEVEEVLSTHPAVAQAVVVAGPHPRLIEVPVAFVVLCEGRTATEVELDTHCREQLANFKVPTRFIFLKELPRTTATMRVQKVKLREMLAEQQHA